MKIKKIMYMFPIILILMLTCSNVTFAADNYLITGEDVLTFTDSLDAKYADSMISFIVLKNGKTINDFLTAKTRESMIDMLECYKQTKADENGNYSVDFSISGSSNYYNAYIGIENSANYKEIKIYYIKESENQAAREMLMDAESAFEIEEIINDEKYSLYLNDKLLENTNIAKMSKFLYESNISEDSVLTTLSGTSAKINKAAAITSFSNDAIKIFSDYYEFFGIDDALSEYFELSFMDTSAKELIESMLNKNPSSFSEFDNDFLISSVKSIVYYADGYGYVKEILLKYADELGIDSSKVTDKVCENLIGNIHDNIYNAVNTAYEKTQEQQSEVSNNNKRTKVKNTVKISPAKAPAIVTEKATLYTTDKVIKFDDLSDAEWAHKAITTLVERGVIDGRENSKFHPNDKVLKEEFVKMIMEVLVFAELDGDVNFEDVSDDDWFASYVNNAYLAGIVQGISDTEFGSGTYISRQDMAVILYNALIKKGVSLQSENQIVEFIDKDKIAKYAVKAIDKLSKEKIILGDNMQCFNPLENTTRAEAAVLIHRILTYLSEGVK